MMRADPVTTQVRPAAICLVELKIGIKPVGTHYVDTPITTHIIVPWHWRAVV